MPDADELYSKDHTPDPVTAGAVAAALAATDRVRPVGRWSRIFMFCMVILVLIGTAGAVLGFLATLSNNRTESTLRTEQRCLVSLLASEQADSVVRTKIANDDREVLDRLVQAITTSKSQADVKKAFDDYKKARAINDRNRANLLISVPSAENACAVTKTKVEGLSAPPSATSTHTTPPARTGGTRASTPAPNPSSRVVVTTAPNGSPVTGTRPVTASKPLPKNPTPIVGTHQTVAPQPTRAASRPASHAPSQSPPAPKPSQSPAPSPTPASRQPVRRVSTLLNTVCTLTKLCL